MLDRSGRRAAWFVVLATLAAAGCSSTGASRIVGEWSIVETDAGGQKLTFRRDGTALWLFESPESTQSYELRYTTDDSSTPLAVDVQGFDRGPLEGLTLFCIVEFTDSDTFRMDCGPGRPDEDAKQVRPEEFSEESLSYRRVG